MNAIHIRGLNKVRRIILGGWKAADDGPALVSNCNGQAASDVIRERLLAAEPCMITRFGRTELRTILRRWNRTKSGLVPGICRYALGKQGPFWWDDEIRGAIRDLSGFFPCTNDALDKFSDLFLRDLRQIDVLGVWCPGEAALAGHFPRAKLIPLTDLEPFHQADPWTVALKGRTVLVVHPFEQSIRKQYQSVMFCLLTQGCCPSLRLRRLKRSNRSVEKNRVSPPGLRRLIGCASASKKLTLMWR